MVKRLFASSGDKETWVQSLGQEDPLEEGRATHSSILAWRIPNTEKPGRLQSIRLQDCKESDVTEMMISPHKYHTYLDEFLEPKI